MAKCRCGGTFRRSDIVGAWDPKYKMVMYSDTDPVKANWKCASCGAVKTQRKRLPKRPCKTCGALYLDHIYSPGQPMKCPTVETQV